MLVLSRKVSQTLQVGDNVILTVIEIQGNRVKIGIDAPRSIKVLRGELTPLPVEAIAHSCPQASSG